MLSQSEMDALRLRSKPRTLAHLVEEQALLSRASKGQQMRVYGYWRAVPKGKRAVSDERGLCLGGHFGEECTVCGMGWGWHSGHRCVTGSFGRFPACVENSHDD